jgi:hypothetical protein
LSLSSVKIDLAYRNPVSRFAWARPRLCAAPVAIATSPSSLPNVFSSLARPITVAG